MAITVLAAVGWGLYRFLGVGRATISDGLGPLLETAGGTARSVRVTSEYVSDAVVTPIIRVRSFIAGVRRALSIFGGRFG